MTASHDNTIDSAIESFKKIAIIESSVTNKKEKVVVNKFRPRNKFQNQSTKTKFS